MDSAAAMQFLVSRVVTEAKVEQVSLSEVEKRMLYFSEIYTSQLPDLYEVNAEFERSYDSNEYEAKIAGLLKAARDHDEKGSPGGEQQWKDALKALKKEDHYILVMVSQAFGARSASSGGNRVRDFLIYIAVGIGVALWAIWKALH